MRKARGAVKLGKNQTMNMGRSWRESWVCVVRVESIGQDLTTSLWGKSCRRGVTWASLARVTCGRYM